MFNVFLDLSQLRAFQYLQCGKDIPSDLAILLGPATYHRDRKAKLIPAPEKVEEVESALEIEQETSDNDMSDDKVKVDDQISETALVVAESLPVKSEEAGLEDYEARCEVFGVLTDMLYHVARGTGYPSMMDSNLKSKSYKAASTRNKSKHEKRVGEFDVILPRCPHGMSYEYLIVTKFILLISLVYIYQVC